MQRKIKVIKKGKVINIFKPCKYSENYIRYEYLYVDSQSTNMHQWRVMGIAIANPDLTDKFLLNSSNEWEGAILEVGAKDFLGGYHGDETNIGISIMADTRLLDIESDFEIECEHLKISAESLLNRCDAPEDYVFRRCKISEWCEEGYIVTNRFELLQDCEIQRFENIMMGLPLFCGEKRFITHAASNNHPIPAYISDDADLNRETAVFHGDHNATSFECFAPEHNFYAKVEGIFDFERYPNGFRLFDNWRVRQHKTLKAYFNMTGKYSGKKGEIFDSKAIYTLEG